MANYMMEFSVIGSVRHLSHLELMKVFRQAFRRGGLPVAYSSGYNPHMKLSFAIAKGVGMESLGELLEIETLEEIIPEKARSLMNSCLPRGILVGRIRIKPEKGKSLSALLKKACYSLTGEEAAIEKALLVLNGDSLMMEVRSKKSVGNKNLKDYICSYEKTPEGMEVVLLTGSEKNLRIDYLLRYVNLDLRGRRISLIGEEKPLIDMQNEEEEVK